MGREFSQKLEQNIDFHYEQNLATYQTPFSRKSLKHLLKLKHLLSHWVNSLI